MLESEFVTDEGTVRIIDCMPIRQRHPEVVRLVEGVRGKVTMEMRLTIRFGYGQVVPWVRRTDGTLTAVAGPDALSLWTTVPTEGSDLSTVAEFTVSEGQTVPFSLSWYPANETPPRPVDASYAIEDTQQWWEEWVSQCTYTGEYREAVVRSLITLKALTYEPTGGIVAAPTTSLPEALGGGRNWDYRFCWLRDATLTLESLMRGGFYQEAMAWRGWLLRAAAGDPSQLQIMYGAAGERRLDEWEVDWLPGYEGAGPVRIGNAAAGQFQLDVYGEVLSALYESVGPGDPDGEASWDLQLALLAFLEDGWREPDDGIWEVRGPRRHFTHSKVMAWVAFDRAIRTVEDFHAGGPGRPVAGHPPGDPRPGVRPGVQRLEGSFTQYYGSDQLDASLLMIPLVGFLPATDPRVRGTIEAIERELMEGDFVLRYRTADSGEVDGLAGQRGGLPRLLVLAGRLPRAARARPRRPPAARAAARPAQRPRPAVRGVRPGGRAARGQLPPGVLARVAGQLGGQGHRPPQAQRRARVPGPGPPGDDRVAADRRRPASPRCAGAAGLRVARPGRPGRRRPTLAVRSVPAGPADPEAVGEARGPEEGPPVEAAGRRVGVDEGDRQEGGSMKATAKNAAAKKAAATKKAAKQATAAKAAAKKAAATKKAAVTKSHHEEGPDEEGRHRPAPQARSRAIDLSAGHHHGPGAHAARRRTTRCRRRPGPGSPRASLELDTLLGGWERVTAGYLIEGDAPVLIETGSQSSVPSLLAHLDRLGLGPRGPGRCGGDPHPPGPRRRRRRRGPSVPEGHRVRPPQGRPPPGRPDPAGRLRRPRLRTPPRLALRSARPDPVRAHPRPGGRRGDPGRRQPLPDRRRLARSRQAPPRSARQLERHDVRRRRRRGASSPTGASCARRRPRRTSTWTWPCSRWASSRPGGPPGWRSPTTGCWPTRSTCWTRPTGRCAGGRRSPRPPTATAGTSPPRCRRRSPRTSTGCPRSTARSSRS